MLAPWTKLRKLNFGNKSLIKLLIRSQIKDANIWLPISGVIFKSSGSVAKHKFRLKHDWGLGLQISCHGTVEPAKAIKLRDEQFSLKLLWRSRMQVLSVG